MLFADLQCWFTVKPEKKERILLNTRRHAVLLRLITHVYTLTAIMFSNLFCNAFIIRILNNFVIKLIFNNLLITWNSRNTLLTVAKDAYLINHSKTIHYTLNYLLNCCLLYYSFKILPTKPQGCFSFFFASVWIMPTFQMTRYVFPGCL